MVCGEGCCDDCVDQHMQACIECDSVCCNACLGEYLPITDGYVAVTDAHDTGVEGQVRTAVRSLKHLQPIVALEKAAIALRLKELDLERQDKGIALGKGMSSRLHEIEMQEVIDRELAVSRDAMGIRSLAVASGKKGGGKGGTAGHGRDESEYDIDMPTEGGHRICVGCDYDLEATMVASPAHFYCADCQSAHAACCPRDGILNFARVQAWVCSRQASRSYQILAARANKSTYNKISDIVDEQHDQRASESTLKRLKEVRALPQISRTSLDRNLSSCISIERMPCPP